MFAVNKTITVYVSLYSMSLWIAFISSIVTGQFNGDLVGIDVGLDNTTLFYIALFNQIIILAVPLLYKIVTHYKLSLGGYRFNININRFSLFMFIIITMNLVFFLTTGVGKVFSKETHPLAPLFVIIAPSGIFYFYYLISREKSGVLFFLNVFLYSSLEIMKGWTGFILVLAIFEMYFFILRHRNSKFLKIPFLFSILMPLLLLIFGGALNKHVFVLKNEIRGNYVNADELSYFDSISLLSSRLTNFSVSAGMYSRVESVVSTAKDQGEFTELKGFARRLFPGVIEDTGFRTLSNSTMLAFFPDYGEQSNVDTGVLMYYYVLFKADPYGAVFSILLSLFLLVSLVAFYRAISNNHNNINIFIFIMIFYLFYTASTEASFVRPYITGVIFFPLLFSIGVIKIRKKSLGDLGGEDKVRNV
ncbi:hypothetical protein PL78_00720 [Yersinia entomophaga]|uniref:O-antigen polymerase n=1 Tax=Yersinia entomophaga TaxID=935293 RepID=A0ABM6BFZ5_YERET|nr:oligosaccharide repeat unit polymerase [Yersinia entomophaga]ANI28365.1 hypothetical protein PL78_00720 [Yersinia entomophaga]